VCSQVVTERQCERGFASDTFGCLLDQCAALEDGPGTRDGECQEDLDCTQVPADCCGCQRGGADTAVHVDDAADHLAHLGCSPDPACPGVDVCEPDAVPMCVAGQCHLVTSGADGGSGPGATLCGSPETGACPAGTVCVLNHPEASEATQLGVGSCQSP
jgi:hypothetical protein